jgi:predicted O-methyltransferase YrrM
VWHRRNDISWLGQVLPDGGIKVPTLPRARDIEDVANWIEGLGEQPLWSGYRAAYDRNPETPWARSEMTRRPNQVRTQQEIGLFFAWLAMQRHRSLIVEFGTAFGISAMYWMAGIEAAGGGRLLTFEPNERWHAIAADHLRRFNPNIVAVLGTFEERIDDYLRDGEKIDVAFVDAIHTCEFVSTQVELLIPRLAPGGLILLDDISFSDDMKSCWQRWADDPRVVASVAVANRVGVLEFARA